MPILIADSGSTKTDWLLINQRESLSLQTQGLNPYFVPANRLEDVFREEVLPWSGQVEAIYFYGAGCKATESKKLIEGIFGSVFPEANVTVETDILGAARALFGDETGVACILGTGTNASVCTQGKILLEGNSLGIWLGDEGSGGYLGKQLITAYLYRELPMALHEAFEALYPDRRDDILRKVYRENGANTYLASFAPFLLSHSKHIYVQQMMREAFEQFCKRILLPLCEQYKREYPVRPSLSVGMSGSIAMHFSAILQDVCKQHDLLVAHLLANPIERLGLYHSA